MFSVLVVYLIIESILDSMKDGTFPTRVATLKSETPSSQNLGKNLLLSIGCNTEENTNLPNQETASSINIQA